MSARPLTCHAALLIHGLRPFDRSPAPKGGRLARISCFT